MGGGQAGREKEKECLGSSFLVSTSVLTSYSSTGLPNVFCFGVSGNHPAEAILI